MRSIIIATAAAALFISGPVFAQSQDVRIKTLKVKNKGNIQGQQQGQQQKQQQGQQQKQGIRNSGNSRSSSRASGNRQRQGIKNSGNSRNYNRNRNSARGNKTNVTVEGDDIPPAAYAPNINLTSSNCIGSASASGGGGGIISIGFGATFTYESCLKNEVAKTLIAMGRKEEAFRVLASIDYIGKHIGKPKQKASLVRVSAGQKVAAVPAGGCYRYDPVSAPYPQKGQAPCENY